MNKIKIYQKILCKSLDLSTEVEISYIKNILSHLAKLVIIMSFVSIAMVDYLRSNLLDMANNTPQIIGF